MLTDVIVQTQEREAKENMKRKAKELQRQRQDALKYGRNASGYGGISGGGGSVNGGRQDIQIVESVSMDNPKPSYTAAPTRLPVHCSVWIVPVCSLACIAVH